MSSSSGSGRTEKGAVNVVGIGATTCKSRTALTPVKAGDHRCHGEEMGVNALVTEADDGTLCTNSDLVDCDEPCGQSPDT